jgi:hypothetical protein
MLDADYAQRSQQQSLFCSDLGLGWPHYGMMLIALVQGVVSSFDEHLPPLEETRGQEPRKHANHHLLNKRRVHPPLRSNRSAITAL